MDKGYIVLEEKLVEAFFDFYEDKGKIAKDLKMRLFKFLKPFNITREQLEKYYKKFADLPDELKVHELTENQYWFVVNKELYQDLTVTNPFSREILERLVSLSTYKVFLASRPYDYNFKEINIASSSVQFSFVEKISKNNQIARQKVQDHLKQLLKGAKKIIIKDNYCKDYIDKIKSLFQEVKISNCDIVIYAERDSESKIKNIFPEAEFKLYDHKTMHDRYLCINDKIEIILTSGFEYLFNDKKELTYIITEK